MAEYSGGGGGVRVYMYMYTFLLTGHEPDGNALYIWEKLPINIFKKERFNFFSW